MTTKVRLETHNWPVRVETTDAGATEPTSEIVPVNSTRDFYIHQTRAISFSELEEQRITPPVDTGFVKAD